MPRVTKYHVNTDGRYVCPNCDKTYKSEFSCSNHWNKVHKALPDSITIETEPMYETRAPAKPHGKSVSRQEFDELKAQYATIIEMLKTITRVNKPVVECCEISTQTEDIIEVVEEPNEVREHVEIEQEVEVEVEVKQPVKELPKASSKPTKKTAEEKYHEDLKNLNSHPYAHTKEDGTVMYRCMYGEWNSPERLIMLYTSERDIILNKSKWTVYLLEEKMTHEEVNELQRKEKMKIQQDSSNFAKFMAAYDRLKKSKKDYEKKNKVEKPKQPKKTKKVVEVVEQPKVEVVDFHERPDHREFLLECCRTMYDGGFAKAYQYLNYDTSKLRIVKQEVVDGTKEVYDDKANDYIEKPNILTTYTMYKNQKAVPSKLSYIREELESFHTTLRIAWKDYEASDDFNPEDIGRFDAYKGWFDVDVATKAIHADNLDMFCQ